MTNREHILVTIKCHEVCIASLRRELETVDPKESMWKGKS